MTEDSFDLTPLDIRTQQFRRVVRGYDPAAIEEFRERIAAEVERLLREKAVTEEQVRSFREQLKTFREREKAMSEALVVAEQLRHDAGQRANDQAAAIIQQARAEADTILNDARLAEKAVQRDTEAAQRQLNAYLAAFRALLERNMAEVEAVDAQQRNGSQAALAVHPTGTGPRRSFPMPEASPAPSVTHPRAAHPTPGEQ